MQNLRGPRGIFFIYSSFVAFVAIFLLGEMRLSPSEPGNALVLGLSFPRLILAVGLLVGFVFFAFLSLKVLRDPAWGERTAEEWFDRNRRGRVMSWVAGVGFGLGWIGSFLPAYRAGPLSVHWTRLHPAMIFLLLVSFATLTIIFIKQSNFATQDSNLSKTLKLGLALFLISLLFIGIMLYSGFGVSAAEDYWYGAGIPVLLSQLIAAIGSGVFFLQIEKKWSLRHYDLIVFLLIYLVTAVLWAGEPLQRSFLFIGPYAPNHVLYPFADSALFDTASQFALIGQNFLFYNVQFFERALYISFLVYLHALVGQDYVQLMALQAAIFAVFPALVYLVGRALNLRAIGFAAAMIAMLRGANSIAASNMIDMANPKMMLTDFPTAIGVALVVLFTIEWLKKPERNWYYAIWVGGIIGLTIMLRTNTLMLLLFIPFYALLKYWTNWKTWLVGSFLLLLAVFAATLPWELRNQSLGGQIYGPIIAKFQNVIQQRYTPPSEPSSSLPGDHRLSILSFRQLQILTALYQETEPPQMAQSCDRVVCFVPNHFLHNILTSILVLPTSPILDDLRHTVRESFPYWDAKWDGIFTAPSLLLLTLNVFFITLGIGVAWKQWQWVGLTPLAIFMFYNISNGFARTSGGRYIVPIDWIFVIYFLIGVFQVVVWCGNALGLQWSLFTESTEPDIFPQKNRTNDLSTIVVSLALLFGVGTLVPLAEKLHERHFSNFDVSKALVEHETEISRAGLSLQEINAFLQNPNAELTVGRALYPRYYIENEGEVHFYPVIVMGFPRTTFTLIGPKGEQGIILPGDKPRYFPQGVDTLVLGCREQYYVDALAVILLDEKGGIYTRSPESSLECPLKQPICDNNHNCY
jgi:hypothetical protein